MNMKKMKLRKTAALLAAALIAFSIMALAGCGGEKAPDWSKLDLDVSKAASDIAKATKFDAEMVDLDADQILMSYGGDIRSAEQLGVTAAGGASAEQVIVAKCGGDTAAAAGEIRVYLSGLAGVYADYAPEEVPKLNGAVIVERGSYVFAVVTADSDGARAAIDAACGVE